MSSQPWSDVDWTRIEDAEEGDAVEFDPDDPDSHQSLEFDRRRPIPDALLGVSSKLGRSWGRAILSCIGFVALIIGIGTALEQVPGGPLGVAAVAGGLAVFGLAVLLMFLSHRTGIVLVAIYGAAYYNEWGATVSDPEAIAFAIGIVLAACAVFAAPWLHERRL